MNSAETDGRPVTMQELAEHSRGVIALCSITSHDSRITNHFSQLKEIFGGRLYIEYSASRREMGAHCAKRSASAANWACGWWRQIMFIFCDPKNTCIIVR